MIDVGLFDGSFMGQNSATLGGDCLGERPKTINWIRWEVGKPLSVDIKTCFYTDMCLDVALYAPEGTKRVAWLIEPKSLSDTHYKFVQEHPDLFDYVLTFNLELCRANPAKFLYYPLGGSWIKEEDWGIFPKTKNCSIIISEKTGAEGHKLRRAIAFAAKELGLDLDIYGRGYNPVKSKIEALRPYRYSIVIESCRQDGYFSEKLIDCLSQGTIPIYWGDNSIGHKLYEIAIHSGLGYRMSLYRALDVIENETSIGVTKEELTENLEIAKYYRCAEDNIANDYPFLFS